MTTTPRGEGSYLFVVPWDIRPPGGVNHVVANLFRQAGKCGPYRPILLTSNWGHPVPQEAIVDGRPSILYRLRSPYVESAPIRAALAFLYQLPRCLYTLLSLLRKHDVRVINLHYPALYALQFTLLKRLRLYRGKLILSFHGMDIEKASELSGVPRLIWHAVLRSADAVVACSRSLSGEVVRFHPACTDRVVTIHNGIDPQSVAEERSEGSLPAELAGIKFILNVGTFERKKGHDVLWEAFRQIANRFPDVMLVLVGSTGETTETVRNAISTGPLNGRVRMYENLPHSTVLAFMEAATIFVMPSRREPFGIAIIEAGMLGRPVVATNVGGIPEIITHNKTGLLVEKDDAMALARALAYLLERPQERARLGHELRSTVLKELTWERAYESYMHVARGKPASDGS
jgi:glycosyltransferase involved in cell wall biosynthesis